MKLNKNILGLMFVFTITTLFGFTNLASASTCKTDRDCPRNFICVETMNGKGICVVDNNRPCTSNGGCPTGWLCISGTCSKGGSGQSCKSNGNCRTGYVCCAGRCVYSHCRDLSHPNQSRMLFENGETETFIFENESD